MSDINEVLSTTRDGIGKLVDGPEADLLVTVPACSAWSAADLLAHLAGLAVDFSAGIAEALAPGYWDHDEVDRREIEPRRGRSPSEILGEWDAITPRFQTVLASAEAALAGAIVGDFVCHYYDLAFSLHRSAHRDDPIVNFGVDVYAGMLERRLAERNLGALRVESKDATWLLGEGEPDVSIRADLFWLFRALTGRRTLAEVRQASWTGDARPYIEIFPMYDWPESSLHE
jgi:uncharacterized protein (TIGR03083 family)